MEEYDVNFVTTIHVYRNGLHCKSSCKTYHGNMKRADAEHVMEMYEKENFEGLKLLEKSNAKCTCNL